MPASNNKKNKQNQKADPSNEYHAGVASGFGHHSDCDHREVQVDYPFPSGGAEKLQ